jgi:hypothetical protein
MLVTARVLRPHAAAADNAPTTEPPTDPSLARTEMHLAAAPPLAVAQVAEIPSRTPLTKAYAPVQSGVMNTEAEPLIGIPSGCNHHSDLPPQTG